MKNLRLLLITIIFVSIAVTVVKLKGTRQPKRETSPIFGRIAAQQFDLAIQTAKQLNLEQTVITDVTAAGKLVTLEVDLEQAVELQNKLFNMDVFKQSKRLVFYAKGTYCVDFAELTPSDVQFSHNNKTITVYIERPEVYTIAIDESKSVAEGTKNAILRFGELKMSPEEYNEIMKTITDAMREEMNSEKMMKTAASASKKSVSDLFFKILAAYPSEYRVIVEWKE